MRDSAARATAPPTTRRGPSRRSWAAAGRPATAAGASGTAAFVAGVLTGLAAGAEVDVTAFLASRYFGLKYFSRTYAWFYSAYSAGAAVGPLITARAVEQSGDYTGILYVHAALLILAGLMLTRLKPFPKAFPA